MYLCVYYGVLLDLYWFFLDNSKNPHTLLCSGQYLHVGKSRILLQCYCNTATQRSLDPVFFVFFAWILFLHQEVCIRKQQNPIWYMTTGIRPFFLAHLAYLDKFIFTCLINFDTYTTRTYFAIPQWPFCGRLYSIAL